jgi:glutamyl-tRNA reductase
MMTEAISNRSGNKLIVMDLAIPRDVDVPKDWNPAVEVHDLEDIKLYVRDQQLQREKAIPQAEEIIGRKLDEFDYWYKHVLHEPIYNGYSNTIESVRQDELGQLFQKLSPELRNELDQVTRRMVNRIIRVASRTASQK